MKKIAKQVTEYTYSCDVCNKEYNGSWGAEICERNHEQETCKHENEYHLDIEPETEYDSMTISSVQRCSKCDKREYKHIRHLEDYFTQDILRDLFEGNF